MQVVAAIWPSRVIIMPTMASLQVSPLGRVGQYVDGRILIVWKSSLVRSSCKIAAGPAQCTCTKICDK